ncbi:MAG TPA: hypothetical protein VFS42_01275, partial [Burkholderiaceae bacterium]|nr:hypothetical protein [Burkholderiaceae bacterium]
MLRRIANSLPLSCFRPPSADDDQVAPHRQDQSPALPGVHRADATEPSAGEENRLLSHSAGNERVEERKTTPKELEQTAESSMRSRLVATLRQQRWIRPRAMNAATSDND